MWNRLVQPSCLWTNPVASNRISIKNRCRVIHSAFFPDTKLCKTVPLTVTGKINSCLELSEGQWKQASFLCALSPKAFTRGRTPGWGQSVCSHCYATMAGARRLKCATEKCFFLKRGTLLRYFGMPLILTIFRLLKKHILKRHFY